MTAIEWPEANLEHLGQCPLYGSRHRMLLYQGLTDETFHSAPGEWCLWRCSACQSAYLDPRPDGQSLPRAYEHYYTHDNCDPVPNASFVGRWRTRLGNGYRNARYDIRLEPASRLGPIVVALIPPLRWPADLALRYLPPAKERSRVLDVGCGCGDWLRSALQIRWDAAGVEPDPIARKVARDRGFDVREKITEFDGESFDANALSHVIEHVHDPVAMLRACRDKLKPSGMIFIDTPNIDAVGHRVYGQHWRGLETPRHLVLFNRCSLRQALTSAGLGSIRFRRRFYPLAGMQRQSQLIAAGLDPYSTAAPPRRAVRFGLLKKLRTTLSKKRTEFLTVTAYPQPFQS